MQSSMWSIGRALMFVCVLALFTFPAYAEIQARTSPRSSDISASSRSTAETGDPAKDIEETIARCNALWSKMQPLIARVYSKEVVRVITLTHDRRISSLKKADLCATARWTSSFDVLFEETMGKSSQEGRALLVFLATYSAEKLEKNPEVIWSLVERYYTLDDDCCCDESQKLQK